MLYDIDTSKEVTSENVRDAILKCFLEAHKEIFDNMDDYLACTSKEDCEKMKSFDIVLFVKQKFKEVEGDFHHPTKESLRAVINLLKEFSNTFRSKDIIKKHYDGIIFLLDKVQE